MINERVEIAMLLQHAALPVLIFLSHHACIYTASQKCHYTLSYYIALTYVKQF